MQKLILALSLSVAAFTTSIVRADDPVVQLRSTNGYLVPVHVSEIKSSYKQIVESEVAALEKIAQQEQEIYKFATSYMTTDDARPYSERLARNLSEPKLLAVVADAFKYATSYAGLSLNSTDAAKFVERLCSLPQAEQRLALHKKTYAFAASGSGMNLYQKDAREYADKKCGLITK